MLLYSWRWYVSTWLVLFSGFTRINSWRACSPPNLPLLKHILRVVVGGQESEHICTADGACSTCSRATALGCLAEGVLDRSFGFAAHAIAADLCFCSTIGFENISCNIGA